MEFRKEFMPKNGKSLYENPDGFKTGETTLKESIENYKYILVLTNIGSFIHYCGKKSNIEFWVSAIANADVVYYNSMVISINKTKINISYNKRWYGNTIINDRHSVYEVIGFNEL